MNIRYIYKCEHCSEKIVRIVSKEDTLFKNHTPEHVAEKEVKTMLVVDKQENPIHICWSEDGYVEAGKTVFIGVKVGEKHHPTKANRNVTVNGSVVNSSIITGTNNR